MKTRTMIMTATSTVATTMGRPVMVSATARPVAARGTLKGVKGEYNM